MRASRFSLLVVLFTYGLSSGAVAQSFLERWTFDGDDVADMTVTTGFGAGVGAPATASVAFGSIGTGTGAAELWAPSLTSYTPGDYFQFSLSLNVPNAYEVKTISLSSSSFMNGATGWEARSDLDGYTMVLGTGLTNLNSPTSLSNLGLDLGSNETFTFRIYGVGGNAATFNGFSVDNVTVTGALVASAVPEPSTAAALLGFGALGFVAAQRRRREVMPV